MPEKQQNIDHLKENYNLAIKNAKKSGIDFFGTPPDFFKAQEYESIFLNYVRKNGTTSELTTEKHQEFNKYINFLVKDILRKSSSINLFIASAKHNKNQYTEAVKQAETSMLNLTDDLTYLKKISEKLDEQNTPTLTQLSLNDYKQIYNSYDKINTIDTYTFYKQRSQKDKNEHTTKTGIKKSYYQPYKLSRSIKWGIIELVPELVFSFFGGVTTLLIAGTFSWPALLGGMAVGFALGAPFSLALHTASHEYQNAFRREFGRSLGDEIKNDLCEKIFDQNKNLNSKQKKQIETKVIEITRGVLGELYDQIGGAIIEDLVFYYLLSPTRIVSDSFAKKEKKIELDKVKKAPLHIISNIVSERILDRIPFTEHIENNTINDIKLPSELKDAVASNIRSALSDFKAAEKKLDILRKEIKKELEQPTPYSWKKLFKPRANHMESFVEQTTKAKETNTSSPALIRQ